MQTSAGIIPFEHINQNAVCCIFIAGQPMKGNKGGCNYRYSLIVNDKCVHGNPSTVHTGCTDADVTYLSVDKIFLLELGLGRGFECFVGSRVE